MVRADLEKLRAFAPFAKLEDGAFRALVGGCTQRDFVPRELIIGQQDQSHDVLFLIAGRARVNVYSPDGQRVSLREMPAGTMFGELSAIDGQTRSASVEALEPCSIAIMPRRLFIKALSDHPEFGLAVMRHVTQLVRRLTDRVFEFSTLVVRGRVQVELLRMIEDLPRTRGELILSPAPTHEEIASRVSTHREAVTRELAWLEAQGVIEKAGRTLKITNLDRLRNLARESFHGD
ncbi:MAG: Crp/Fnr family transcriptional regulator [Rhizobiales bacterium]|nr:Crp/Fnr family transcriptional regulator [Hyphomicrobiales bacterium]